MEMGKLKHSCSGNIHVHDSFPKLEPEERQKHYIEEGNEN